MKCTPRYQKFTGVQISACLTQFFLLVLDPTRKDKWYAAVGWSQDWIRSCKTHVKRLWNSSYKTELDDKVCDLEPPSKKAKNSVEEQMEQQMFNIPRGTPEDELTRYLREPVALPGTDILAWWKVINQIK